MADKDKEQYYAPPPKRSTGEQIRQFLWNSETHQFLGRTAGSWAKILLFYLIFYLILCIYWGGLWMIFDKIAINPSRPKFMLKESLIGNNPGLGYRPMPSEEYVESALIWFKQSDYGFVNWTNQIGKFLEPYNKISKDPLLSNNVQNCSYDNPKAPGKVCRVPLDRMQPCNQQFYKYDAGSPCIFLKLNKIYNWVPDFYNDTNHLPEKMPQELKNKIREKAKDNPKELNTVWISCGGENAADKEHIGIIHMFPQHGFPGFYFPFSNEHGYLSPLVAVWFQNPARGVLINVECKAWAKNIIYDRHDRRGSVHFELMIDY